MMKREYYIRARRVHELSLKSPLKDQNGGSSRYACWRRAAALGLSSGLLLACVRRYQQLGPGEGDHIAKHLRRKSSPTGGILTSGGSGGAESALESFHRKVSGCPMTQPCRLTLNMAAYTCSSSQGRRPAHISKTTQPTLQMSNLNV
jgi:hypothetical protein